MPIPGLSSHRLLGISKQDGRYTDALASGRLTFAVLILGLGSAAGIVNDSMLSSATLVVAMLAAISALLAHRLHNSESTKPTEDH
jgi:Kef-type K+ transport system membrane component KefB